MASLSLLTLLCLALPPVQDAPGPARPRAGEPGAPVGRLARELVEADRLADPALRAVRRAGIFFEARDFAAVLREVERGLEHDPDRLELLWRASASELWLQDGGRALGWIERLRESAQRAELEPDQRRSWLDAAAGFEEQALELDRLQEAGKAALARARLAVGLVALAASLVILALIANRRAV